MVLQQWVANTEQRVAGRRWGRCRGGEGGGGERRNGCTGTHGTSISNYSALFRRPSCCCKRCSQEVPTIDFSQGRERHRREGGGRRKERVVASGEKRKENCEQCGRPRLVLKPVSSLASRLQPRLYCGLWSSIISQSVGPSGTRTNNRQKQLSLCCQRWHYPASLIPGAGRVKLSFEVCWCSVYCHVDY